MKKYLTTSWCTCLSAILLSCSANLYGGPREVLLQELTMNHFVGVGDANFLDYTSSEGVVIKVEAGTKLPLRINVNGPIISLEQGALQAVLVIHKTFYIKALPVVAEAECTYCDAAETAETQPQFLFSQDNLSWYSFEEFFGGTLNTSLVPDDVSSKPIAEISLDIEFKQK